MLIEAPATAIAVAGASARGWAVFGRLSRPAVTRCAAASPSGLRHRVNLSGIALERDGRSAARVAERFWSEPAFVQRAREPIGRVPG